MSALKNLIVDKLPIDLQIKIKGIVDLLLPYTKRAYMVGGCVRDLFLGNKIKDIDIEVYDITPVEFDRLMKKMGAQGVGKSFFVYKLGDVDLSLPRIEKKVGIGHKAFDVELSNNEKIASKRRDFSMNAIMINIFTNELLDFWGGQKSIEKKQIKLIEESSFKEDSLRVLRAVQFSARFGFDIEKNTLCVMKSIDINDLSKTRIFWELEKLFRAKYLGVGFFYMNKLGLYEKLFKCKPSQDDIKRILSEFESACFVENLREYYFLYIVANMLGFSPYEWSKLIKAPNRYLNIYKKQPFVYEILSDKDLMCIAIDIPIKKWLGNYKKSVKASAKRLGIWEECFSGEVSIQDVIEDGFKKEDIKKEYKRRVLKVINGEING